MCLSRIKDSQLHFEQISLHRHLNLRILINDVAGYGVNTNQKRFPDNSISSPGFVAY